jgi:hypothetical protein
MTKLKFFTIAIAAIILAVGFSSYTNAPAKPDEGFKNLKILPKDITRDQLHETMNGYCIALGVNCGFCHARKKDTTQRGLDFASDEKEEKGIAREMMTMVNTLNANNFNFNKSTKPDTIHVILCYTCHRGMKQPSAENLMPEIKKAEEDREKQWKEQHPNNK